MWVFVLFCFFFCFFWKKRSVGYCSYAGTCKKWPSFSFCCIYSRRGLMISPSPIPVLLFISQMPVVSKTSNLFLVIICMQVEGYNNKKVTVRTSRKLFFPAFFRRRVWNNSKMRFTTLELQVYLIINISWIDNWVVMIIRMEADDQQSKKWTPSF